MTLTLLTTKGQPHNLTPLRQRMEIPQFCEGLRRDVKTFHFFLDGLLSTLAEKTWMEGLLEFWRRRAVGISANLMILERPYEGSFQEENLNIIQERLIQDWPGDAERIYRSLAGSASR